MNSYFDSNRFKAAISQQIPHSCLVRNDVLFLTFVTGVRLWFELAVEKYLIAYFLSNYFKAISASLCR